MGNTIFLDNIPSELKSRPQWIVWRLEIRRDAKPDSKPSKVPYNAITGRMAKTTDSTTWSSFEDAVKTFNEGSYNGIGFVFSEGDGLFGIDIDHCLSDDSPRENLDAKKRICEWFKNTYTEISPSGDGIRIFGVGQPVRCGKGTTLKAVELYDHSSPRYLTVTGNRVSESQITDCQTQLNQLHAAYFFKPTSNSSESIPATLTLKPMVASVASNQPAETTKVDTVTPSVTNDKTSLDVDSVLKLLNKAKNSDKFKSLMNGGGPQDESTGDFQLCSMIAFYSQDSAIIDTIFRQSKRANLANGKWDKKNGDSTYGGKTIAAAIKKLSKTYQPTYKPELILPAEWHKELNIHSQKVSDTTEYFLPKAPTFPNMCVILKRHPDLQGAFKYNEFTLKVDATPVEKTGLPTGEVDDNFVSKIRLFFNACLPQYSSQNVTWSAQDTYSAIIATAKENPHHPVREYLNSLTWDGTPRIDDFFSDFCGTVKNDYTIFVANSFFVSAVARVMSPACKVDTMVILEGKQGLGKSSLFAALCSNLNWFKDSDIAIGSKDAYTGLVGKWIIEMSELDSLSRVEITAVKSFLTSRIDSYRPPYEKCDMNVPRQCVFVGSTNKDTYLRDETGGRRFLPVKVTEIDLDSVVSVRDQLWAEAVMLYRHGFQWWTDKNHTELFNAIQYEQAQRYESDPWESAIADLVQKQPVFTIQDIAKDALFISIKDLDKRTEMRIAKTLEVLGCHRERRTIKGTRNWVWIAPKHHNSDDTPAF